MGTPSPQWSKNAQRIASLAKELLEAALAVSAGSPEQYREAISVIDDLDFALDRGDQYAQASMIQMMPEKVRDRIQAFAQNPATVPDLLKAVKLARSSLSAGHLREMLIQSARQLGQTQVPTIAAREAAELAKGISASSVDDLIKGFLGTHPQARATLRALLGTPTDPEFVARVGPFMRTTPMHLRESLIRAKPELLAQLEQVAQPRPVQTSGGPPPTSRGYGWLALPIAATMLYFLLSSRKQKPRTWTTTSELQMQRQR